MSATSTTPLQVPTIPDQKNTPKKREFPKKRYVSSTKNCWIGRWPLLSDPEMAHLTSVTDSDNYGTWRLFNSYIEIILEHMDDFRGHGWEVLDSQWEFVYEEYLADEKALYFYELEKEGVEMDVAEPFKPSLTRSGTLKTKYYRNKRHMEELIIRGLVAASHHGGGDVEGEETREPR